MAMGRGHTEQTSKQMYEHVHSKRKMAETAEQHLAKLRAPKRRRWEADAKDEKQTDEKDNEEKKTVVVKKEPADDSVKVKIENAIEGDETMKADALMPAKFGRSKRMAIEID